MTEGDLPRAGRASGDHSKRRDAEGLWAITCYFNPAGSQRRRANYRRFRERLGVPLATVELAYGDSFELGGDDADRLIQLRGEDILWQKERLLNLALAELPSACATVAWLDCDVIIAARDWPVRALEALERHRLVQLFSRVHFLPATWPAGDMHVGDAVLTRPAVVAAIDAGMGVRGWVDGNGGVSRPKLGLGYAWAAPREILDRHGFYDACIIGGGDRALLSGAYGCFEHVIKRQHMNESQRERYLTWARPFYEDVDGAVAFVPGDLFHLWHGELGSRLYARRHEELSRLAFDPATDITVAANGSWRWNSEKPGLHAYLRQYFAIRSDAELEVCE